MNPIDRQFFIELNNQKPTVRPKQLISDYIEGKRVLPPSTPFPGFWRNSRTPYGVEIMDNMSPISPIQHTVVMKGAQIGLTASAENVIAYWIDECPAEILFISATERLLEKWATKRLEPLIDSCDFRHKIFSQVEHKQSRRTGDKLYIKEFIGGCLDMASAQSASSLRSDSKRILIRDEIDGSPAQLRTGEGSWLDVSFVRTNAWGARRKVLDFSTPTTLEDSLIHKEFVLGDQRHFFVPCPHCGKFQFLEWGDEQSGSGMKAETKAGRLESVFYVCSFCRDQIFNHHKGSMFAAGRWEPTAISQSKYLRSYYISSLYSPIGMLSWFELYEKYLRAHDDPDGMRSFTNLYLGLPFKEAGSRPKLSNVIALRGGYSAGEVPNGVLFLTAGIDVQQGSARDRENPPRLELEICGHGAGFRTWSIHYLRFEGDVSDPYSGAWAQLNEYARETGLTFRRSDGLAFPVMLVFVDSGDGNLTDVVYRFTTTWANTFPSKGFQALRNQKKEAGDTRGIFNVKRYRPVKVNEDLVLYEISTNYYKTHLYNNLRIERQPGETQRPGFCDFPLDYTETYFKMLTAEEKRSDGSFHLPSGRRNESLDCRVMNQCAGDVYLDSQVMAAKSKAMADGVSRDKVQVINHMAVLEYLARQCAPKKNP